MQDKIEDFINKVIDRLVVDEQLKTRIGQDLRAHINEASLSRNEEEVLGKMGSPSEVAREFMDSIYENKNEVIERLIRERLKVKQLLADYFEYRSKAHIFGLPLLHIKFRRHLKAKPGTAKGIIAIGNRAIGAVAVGRFCCGGLCFGIFPIGLVAFGSFSSGVIAFGGFAVGIMALGGIAAGLLAAGGIAFGLSAFGGFAFGFISGGGIAQGVVAMGGHTIGEYIGTPSSAEQIKALIRQAYPHISEWILNIIVFFKFFYT